MKLRLFFSALFLGLSAAFGAATPPAPAAAAPAASPTSELEALVRRINEKLKKGERTTEQLSAELTAFDALVAKYRAQKTDEVAQIIMAETSLYVQVLGDYDRAISLLKMLKADFPSTSAGAEAGEAIASLEAGKAEAAERAEIEAKAAKVQTALIGKPAPELHFDWSTNADLKTLSALKGRVVVLDFWATWCGPCVASFPDVRELTAHYKGLDVAVVGVTSIQGSIMGLEPARIDTRDNPKKEMELMAQFVKAKDMTWTVAIAAEQVFNPEYGIMGIPYVAIVAPDGTVRHTGLHPSMPAEEKYEKIDAILKEFGKKLPPASEPNK